MREAEVMRVSTCGEVSLESMRGYASHYQYSGLYVVIPVQNEQEGWQMIDELKKLDDRRFGQPHHGHDNE